MDGVIFRFNFLLNGGTTLGPVFGFIQKDCINDKHPIGFNMKFLEDGKQFSLFLSTIRVLRWQGKSSP